jgi:hypothetical protein
METKTSLKQTLEGSQVSTIEHVSFTSKSLAFKKSEKLQKRTRRRFLSKSMERNKFSKIIDAFTISRDT